MIIQVADTVLTTVLIIYSMMVFLVVASFSYLLSFLLCVLPKPSNMPGCILNFTRGKLLHFGHFLSGNPIPPCFFPIGGWIVFQLPFFRVSMLNFADGMGNWFPSFFEAPNPSVVINNFAGFHCQGAGRRSPHLRGF